MSLSYYLAGLEVSLLGLWLLWFYGWKEFLDARFRYRLFTVRSELFALAAEGELPFESAIYCQLRFRLNALLRFAHRVSLLSLVVALVADPAPAASDVFQARWKEGLKSLPPKTKAEVERLEQQMLGAFASHIVWGSILLITSGIAMRGLMALKDLAAKMIPAGRKRRPAETRRSQDILESVNLASGAKLLEDEAYREQLDNSDLEATLA